MPSPLITATIQSAIITLCSCIIATFLTPDKPPHTASLILYSILATPPNFLWQHFIESYFPGYTLQKAEVDDGGKGVEVAKKLNVRNSCIKVVLDQTVAAVINVAAYIGVTRLLRGVPVEMCWTAAKEQTWPMMKSGWVIWPLFCSIQHIFIPMEKKTLVGNLMGLGWGTFLALRASQ